METGFLLLLTNDRKNNHAQKHVFAVGVSKFKTIIPGEFLHTHTHQPVVIGLNSTPFGWLFAFNHS